MFRYAFATVTSAVADAPKAAVDRTAAGAAADMAAAVIAHTGGARS